MSPKALVYSGILLVAIVMVVLHFLRGNKAV